jgi:Tfp pilus tip-associated adhesin PilY1
MKSKRKYLLLALILGSIFLNSNAHSQSDEEGLFTTVASDALIVLDLSGSMLWTPAGAVMYINSLNNCDSSSAAFYDNSGPSHDKSCNIDPYGTVPKYSDASCSGPFYKTSDTGHTTDCSRLGIAKRAVFDVLDNNDDNTIDRNDEQDLNIRFGYMRFYSCNSDDTGGSYSSGCNSLVRGLGTKYSQIYCNSSSSCSSSSSSSGSVSGESASGGTPLASALNEAKLYLDANKAADSAAACRQKFVILITDGSDTFACNGNGDEDQTDQYKRRRKTITKAKALADAGYKVFVVGFGSSMPHWLRNTLNWAAFYGGTDNPIMGNSGDTSAYNPSSVTECQTETTAYHNIEGDGTHYYATSNDPGEVPLSGYAFLASSANELTTSLKQAIEMIRAAIYSFSTSSVSSQRTLDENNIYEASFEPVNDDPFWRGHLKKYNINSDGSVGTLAWDAGDVLQSTAATSRSIFTYKSGALTVFLPSNMTKEDLGVSTDAERDSIVGYFRGESARNPDNWKMGDIFHSNPLTVGTPSSFFEDIRDTNDAFATFRQNHQRTSANGGRIIMAGANEGQLHAFKALDGTEVWSFIPPNFLPRLKNIAHASHPTGLTHQFFVDGPVTGWDVWLGTGDGSSKSATDWETLVIFGEGRGGGTTLWSSSSYCDSGFNAIYSSTYSNYCGYYAFDFTNTLSAAYKWRLIPTASQAPYLGEPWSKILMGRVKINGNEKWVGFIGGGYNATDCAGGGGSCDSRGKGFFVVDLSNGNILWSYTRANDSTMNYSLPASPSIVDADNDGFIDTAYIGDLGGSMWRFKFCTASDGSTCSTSNWSGTRLFEASTGVIRPIFTMPTLSKDYNGNLWVNWGTGDKTDPTAANAQEKFYVVKDNDRSGTLSINDLENITTGTYTDSSTKHGWYINLAGQGEKILAESTVFGGAAYFSTYTPPAGGDPCAQGGTAKLYGVNFTTGAGILVQLDAMGQPMGSPSRSLAIGTGIPSAPIFSMKPAGTVSIGPITSPADIYMTASGGGGTSASTMRVNFNPPTLANRTNLLYWKDRRLE